MTKPFTWSWSKLKNYRTCPKRHYEIDIAKSIKEDKGEALLWGDQFHEGMAKYVGKGIPLPPTMKRYQKRPDELIRMREWGGYKVMVEQKLAMDNEFQATGYFDPHTWFRAIADVLVIVPENNNAITIDWKTGGTVKPEFEQLALSSQTVFAHYPEITSVTTYYYWAGHDAETKQVYYRDNMVETWAHILPEVKQMEAAAKNMDYPPKPSGLCRGYCPVISCPFHGKGSF